MRLLLVTISVALVFSPVIGQTPDTKFMGAFGEIIASAMVGKPSESTAPASDPAPDAASAPAPISADVLEILVDFVMMYTDLGALYQEMMTAFEMHDLTVDNMFNIFELKLGDFDDALDDVFNTVESAFEEVEFLFLLVQLGVI